MRILSDLIVVVGTLLVFLLTTVLKVDTKILLEDDDDDGLGDEDTSALVVEPVDSQSNIVACLVMLDRKY